MGATETRNPRGKQRGILRQGEVEAAGAEIASRSSARGWAGPLPGFSIGVLAASRWVTACGPNGWRLKEKVA